MRTKEKYVSVLKSQYEKSKQEIALAAIFNSVYTEKVSKETIHTKVANQLNSMRISISRINPKFNEKSKNYDKMEEQLLNTLNQYEANLIHFCQNCDAEINAFILEKVELETKFLALITEKEFWNRKRANDESKMLHTINRVVEKIKTKKKCQQNSNLTDTNIQEQEFQKRIEKLKKQIKLLNTKINDLNEQKVTKIFDAMESGDKQLSTQIRKPRTLKKITRFFMNRFNPYSTILKNVIEPVNQRIEEFKIKELKNVINQNQEFDLQKIEQKIKQKQVQVFEQINAPILNNEKFANS